MKKWLWMSASALYAGLSAHAAFAAQTVKTTHPRPVTVAADAGYEPLAEPANFDASMSLPVKSLSHQAPRRLTQPDAIRGDLRIQRLNPAGMLDTHVDKTLHRPTFIWPGKKAAQGLNYVAYRQGEGAAIYGRTYLKQFSSQLQISAAAIDHARLVFLHDNGTGPVIARYQQVVDGWSTAS